MLPTCCACGTPTRYQRLVPAGEEDGVDLEAAGTGTVLDFSAGSADLTPQALRIPCAGALRTGSPELDAGMTHTVNFGAQTYFARFMGKGGNYFLALSVLLTLHKETRH